MLAKAAKRSDLPKRQLLIDPRTEGGSLLSAQKKKFLKYMSDPSVIRLYRVIVQGLVRI